VANVMILEHFFSKMALSLYIKIMQFKYKNSHYIVFQEKRQYFIRELIKSAKKIDNCPEPEHHHTH
jgi:hypothetical protein